MKKPLSPIKRHQKELVDAYEQNITSGKPYFAEPEDITDIAEWYSENQQFDEALKAVEQGLFLHPNDLQLLIEQAYVYFDMGSDDQAWGIYHQIVDQTDEVRILHANLLMAKGEVDEAEAILAQLDEPDFLPTVVDVAFLYIDNNYPQKALSYMEQYTDRYLDDEWFLACYADALANCMHYNEAIEYYNKLIDSDPYNGDYWYTLARCHAELQEYEKAIEACDYALVSDSDDVDALSLKASCFTDLDNPEEALKIYLQAEKCLKGNPSFQLLIAIGTLKLDFAEYDQAYDYLSRSLKTMPDNVSTYTKVMTYCDLAFAAYKTGHRNEAYQLLRDAWKIDSSVSEILAVGIRIALEEKKSQEAIELVRQSLSIDSSTENLELLNRIAHEYGQFHLALIITQLLYKNNPNTPFIHEQLCLLYVAAGDMENVRKHNALSRHPYPEEMLQKLEELIHIQDSKELEEKTKEMADRIKIYLQFNN